jgi:alpha-galactosidase
MGADVRNLDQYSMETLLNKEIAAINQDPFGKQAVVIHNGTLQVYAKAMVDGGYAVSFSNRGGDTRNMSVSP